MSIIAQTIYPFNPPTYPRGFAPMLPMPFPIAHDSRTPVQQTVEPTSTCPAHGIAFTTLRPCWRCELRALLNQMTRRAGA